MECVVLAPDSAEEIREMADLATRIVGDYYDPIIGPAQNAYMLEKFQTSAALRAQLAAGYTYYFARVAGRNIGFFAFYPRGQALYVSKLYLLAGERRKGYGRKMLAFLTAEARRQGLAAIELNVNKHNAGAIAAYERLGFTRLRAEKIDIGAGFFMDDYVYRLAVCP